MSNELAKRKKYFRLWLVRGGVGASLFGFGLCLTIESGFKKFNGSPATEWFTLGTIALVVTIAGLCLLIDSLRFKLKLDKIKKRNLL